MNFELPNDVKYILKKLKKNDFKGYIVGGCVRDLLLKKVPKDWDIATDASVEDIKSTFKKTIDVGVLHGTVIVVINCINYEITTLKSDNSSLFKSDIRNDLLKRDLTINAIAYNTQDGLIDPFDGQKDLKVSIIRAVENPKQRFLEDPLRMLRALRLSAQLGFEIEVETFNEIKKNADKILGVSVERVRQELTKILLLDPGKLEALYETRLLKYILPDFDACFGVSQNHPYHLYDVARHTILVIKKVCKSEELVWSALLHDIGKPLTKSLGNDGFDHFKGHVQMGHQMAKDILKYYKFDNKFIETVLILIKKHDEKIYSNKVRIKKLLYEMGKDNLQKLLKLKVADDSAKRKGTDVFSCQNEREILDLIEEIIKNKECFSLNQLAITGHDLKKIGLNQGKEMGVVLKNILNLVLEDPTLNTKDKLSELAIRIINKHCQR